ncbi:MAG: DUF6356 family protein [Rickettsiales bacterium]
MAIAYREKWKQCVAWVTREEHRTKARELTAELNRAFTEHPHDTGETYPQHLWFTVKLSARFLYTTIVLMIHGLFPFLLTRAASDQIEIVYRIMKSRIPKSRRDAIDADYSV